MYIVVKYEKAAYQIRRKPIEENTINEGDLVLWKFYCVTKQFVYNLLIGDTTLKYIAMPYTKIKKLLTGIFVDNERFIEYSGKRG